MMKSIAPAIALALASSFATLTPWMSSASAFVALAPPTTTRTKTTSLNLEDHIADMIDGEKRRLDLKHHLMSDADMLLEEQRKRRESRMLIEPDLPEGFDFDGADYFGRPLPGFTGGGGGVDRSPPSGPMRRKDERMAEDDPMRYCADRCVSTGNCDVFEDMFDMGPEEVVKFCTECVLSEEEEPCDVPQYMFNSGGEDDGDISKGEGLGPSGMHP